jgi:peptide/nickel transport system substrate-binding protein
LIIRLFIVSIILIIQSKSLQGQPAAARPESGDRLKIGYVYTLAPKISPLLQRTDYEQEINKLVFGDGLFAWSEDGYITQGLAQSSVFEPPKAWRINLRSDITFHDGSAITAEDVKFSYELYLKFAYQASHLFSVRLISTIEILNPLSLRIALKEPVTNFRESIGRLPVLSKKNYEAWLDYNLLSSLPEIKPVGNGNFLFKGRLNGSEIQLDRFQGHVSPAYLNGVDFVLFETYEQLVDAFLKNKVDLIEVQGKSIRQKILQVAPDIEKVIIQRDDLRLYYIDLNNTRPPFNDLNIRQAINYAVNKNVMVEKYLENKSYIASNVLSTRSEYFFEPASDVIYDPLRCLRILSGAGYKRGTDGKLLNNGRELKFDFYFQEGSVFQETLARLISINLVELGINIVPKPLPASELESHLEEGRYQAVLRSFVFDPNPGDQALRDFYLQELNRGNGFNNFRNSSIDQLVRFSEKVMNQEQMRTIIYRIQHLINQYSPCIFLFYDEQIYYAVNNRFKNIRNMYNAGGEYIIKLYPKSKWYVPRSQQIY